MPVALNYAIQLSPAATCCSYFQHSHIMRGPTLRSEAHHSTGSSRVLVTAARIPVCSFLWARLVRASQYCIYYYVRGSIARQSFLRLATRAGNDEKQDNPFPTTETRDHHEHPAEQSPAHPGHASSGRLSRGKEINNVCVGPKG